jgi:hypothetical protein
MSAQQKQDGQAFTDSDGFNFLYFLISVFAMAFFPFLRKGQGKRAIGLNALLAMLLMLYYAGRTRSPEMLMYFYAWLAMLFVRRFTADSAQHSQYQGYPVIGCLVKDEMLARCGEAVLVWVAGCLIDPWSHPLGQFLMWGSLALVIKFFIESMYQERRDEALHDAAVEMENLARRSRRQR